MLYNDITSCNIKNGNELKSVYIQKGRTDMDENKQKQMVSIIVPVYNVENYLKEYFENIVNINKLGC